MGQGCETSTFRACNCVGMISADGSKKHLPNALSDAIIESNILLVSPRGGSKEETHVLASCLGSDVLMI